jgi:RNA-binding protein YhbY
VWQGGSTPPSLPMKFSNEEKEILINAVKHSIESHEVVKVDFAHNEAICNRANEKITDLEKIIKKIDKL